jgi:hypothetical protein
VIEQQLLVLLILVPIISYVIARRRVPRHAFVVLGVTFGAIVSPWALGLYSFYFWSPWGIVPGFLGLVLMLIHGPPGFELAGSLGLIPKGVVSGSSSNLAIELINGVVWASVYAVVGYAIDWVRRRRLQRIGGP